MGTSRTPGELAAKLGKAAALYANLDRATVNEAARVTQETIKAGAPSVLRGVGKGAKLDVKANIGNYADGAQAKVYASGPWQLIEENTHAHIITPKGAKGLGAGRASRGRAATSLLGAGPRLSGLNIGFGSGAVLHFGNDSFATYAKHPGTQGKHPWAKGEAAAIPLVATLFETQGTIPLRSVF